MIAPSLQAAHKRPRDTLPLNIPAALKACPCPRDCSAQCNLGVGDPETRPSASQGEPAAAAYWAPTNTCLGMSRGCCPSSVARQFSFTGTSKFRVPERREQIENSAFRRQSKRKRGESALRTLTTHRIDSATTPASVTYSTPKYDAYPCTIQYTIHKTKTTTSYRWARHHLPHLCTTWCPHTGELRARGTRPGATV